jgi:proteasome alpha subunit
MTSGLAAEWHEGMALDECVRLAVRLLGADGDEQKREMTPAQLEVAVLDRSRPRRTFQRVSNGRLAELLAS